MSSFCSMSTFWRPPLIRGTISWVSCLPILTRPIRTFTSSNITNYFVCSCKNTQFYAPQKQLLLPNSATNRLHCKFFNVGSTFISLASTNEFPFQHKKKMGILKTRQKRSDWIQGEELIKEMILEKGEDGWTHENWANLSVRLSEISTGSWEILCIIYFYNTSNVALGKSLIDYILSQPEEPSALFITYCIGLLGYCGDTDQEETMKKFYDDLMSVTDILDAWTMEVLSKGLSRTKYYKECETLVNKAKETNSLSNPILSNTLIGALRNHDHDLCNYTLSHFDDGQSASMFLQQFPLIIEEALKSGNKIGMRLFFSFLNKMDLIPPQEIVESILESLERYEPGEWTGRVGYIHYVTGRCSVCKQIMEEVSVPDEDFKAIQSTFLDQVIISDNVFYKSTPSEVQSFITFVEENGPFDVVIDGLNVLYKGNHGARLRKPDLHVLLQLESSLIKEGHRVLILGNKVLSRHLQKRRMKSSFFGTSTTKADDAFFLYAALHSGKETLIVSADKLRDHKFRLEPKLRPVFHRWLKLAQVFDLYLNPYTDNFVLKRQKFNLGPVEDKVGWHLPFDDTNAMQPFGKNGILCLRQGSENFIIDKKHHRTGSNKSKFSNSRSHPNRSKHDSVPWYEDERS